MLSHDDKKIILGCLRACYYGEFIPGDEFHAVCGFYREELLELIKKWPDIELNQQCTYIRVRGAIAQIDGYPHNMEEELMEYIDIPQWQLSGVLRRFKDAYGQNLSN